MIPDGRGREKSASVVFFTTPCSVAKNTKTVLAELAPPAGSR